MQQMIDIIILVLVMVVVITKATLIEVCYLVNHIKYVHIVVVMSCYCSYKLMVIDI